MQAESFFNRLQKQFDRTLAYLPGTGDPELREIRKNAFSKALKMNFPTSKHPTWKYTQFDNFIPASLKIHRRKTNIAHHEALLQFPVNDAYYFVFINGFFVQAFSHSLSKSPFGIKHFKTLTEKQDPLIAELLSESSQSTQLFHLLNAALVNDGVLLIIPEHFKNDKPIIIQHYLVDHGDHHYLVSPQLHIHVEKYAHANIIEQTFSSSNHPSLINAQTFLKLNPHSQCDYIHLDHGQPSSATFTHLSSTQHRDSSLKIHAASYGGKYHRMEIQHKILDEQTHFSLEGLMIANQNTHHDWVTKLTHFTPGGESNQLVKSIIENGGHASFLGNITVNPGSNKTLANMENYHLVLGNQARADSSPQLEIFCDDLKCNHRSNTTQLSETDLFYLMSRGLSYKQASDILIQAYANSFLKSINNSSFETYFNKKLRDLLQNVILEGKNEITR